MSFETLEHVLEELNLGGSVAIELVGDPGIGKTRLVRELSARAEDRGHLVLVGSASELERALPFSVFVDALDEYVESLDPNLFSSLDDDVQAELAHVLPSLSALAGGRAGGVAAPDPAAGGGAGAPHAHQPRAPGGGPTGGGIVGIGDDLEPGHGGAAPPVIDDDVREEYWRDIRGVPDPAAG